MSARHSMHAYHHILHNKVLHTLIGTSDGVKLQTSASVRYQGLKFFELLDAPDVLSKTQRGGFYEPPPLHVAKNKCTSRKLTQFVADLGGGWLQLQLLSQWCYYVSAVSIWHPCASPMHKATLEYLVLEAVLTNHHAVCVLPRLSLSVFPRLAKY
jgi:hypothetical protein